MSTTRTVIGIAASTLAALALVATAAPARADTTAPAPSATVVADTSAPGEVVATTTTTTASGIRVEAPRPRTVVVTGHGGRPVALVHEGTEPLRVPRPGRAPATFTSLTPGSTYTVIVGGLRVGAVTALDRPAPVSRIVVHRTTQVGTVQVTWQHRSSRGTGRAGFDVAASAPGAPTVRSIVGDVRSTTLTGLRSDALYTFTVTPRNSAGAGRPTSAVMARLLGGPMSDPAPTAPLPTAPATPEPNTRPAPAPVPAPAPAAESAPSPAPSPAPTPTPAPAPAPTTVTVYICPKGYAENAAGTCTSRLAYTFHEEAAGAAPMLSSVETSVRACPHGANLEDYGWVMYCRTYGPVPTRTVKDLTPVGYADTGSAWECTVPKDAVIIRV